MGFFGDLKRGFKKVGKVIVKTGTTVVNKANDVFTKTQGRIDTAVNVIGDKIGQSADVAINAGKNVSNLASPQNLLLYAGVFIGFIYLVPRILETPAATEAAKRIPV